MIRFADDLLTVYLRDESKVIYQSNDGKENRPFDPLEWLAAMCSHVPNKGEQMVRYYGFYSNVSRGRRKRQNQDALIPSILEPDEDSKAYRKNWAKMIQRFMSRAFLLDPLPSGIVFPSNALFQPTLPNGEIPFLTRP